MGEKITSNLYFSFKRLLKRATKIIMYKDLLSVLGNSTSTPTWNMK